MLTRPEMTTCTRRSMLRGRQTFPPFCCFEGLSSGKGLLFTCRSNFRLVLGHKSVTKLSSLFISRHERRTRGSHDCIAENTANSLQIWAAMADSTPGRNPYIVSASTRDYPDANAARPAPQPIGFGNSQAHSERPASAPNSPARGIPPSYYARPASSPHHSPGRISLPPGASSPPVSPLRPSTETSYFVSPLVLNEPPSPSFLREFSRVRRQLKLEHEPLPVSPSGVNVSLQQPYSPPPSTPNDEARTVERLKERIRQVNERAATFNKPEERDYLSTQQPPPTHARLAWLDEDAPTSTHPSLLSGPSYPASSSASVTTALVMGPGSPQRTHYPPGAQQPRAATVSAAPLSALPPSHIPRLRSGSASAAYNPPNYSSPSPPSASFSAAQPQSKPVPYPSAPASHSVPSSYSAQFSSQPASSHSSAHPSLAQPAVFSHAPAHPPPSRAPAMPQQRPSAASHADPVPALAFNGSERPYKRALHTAETPLPRSAAAQAAGYESSAAEEPGVSIGAHRIPSVYEAPHSDPYIAADESDIWSLVRKITDEISVILNMCVCL